MKNYTQVINSTPTVLVEFYATWCPHCKRMMPVVEQIREMLDGTVNIAQIDIDLNQELSSNLGVESTPTFIIYRDGQEVWRRSGEMPGSVLLAKIEQYM